MLIRRVIVVQLGWCRHSYDIRRNNGTTMLKGKVSRSNELDSMCNPD